MSNQNENHGWSMPGFEELRIDSHSPESQVSSSDSSLGSRAPQEGLPQGSGGSEGDDRPPGVSRGSRQDPVSEVNPAPPPYSPPEASFASRLPGQQGFGQYSMAGFPGAGSNMPFAPQGFPTMEQRLGPGMSMGSFPMNPSMIHQFMMFQQFMHSMSEQQGYQGPPGSSLNPQPGGMGQPDPALMQQQFQGLQQWMQGAGGQPGNFGPPGSSLNPQTGAGREEVVAPCMEKKPLDSEPEQKPDLEPEAATKATPALNDLSCEGDKQKSPEREGMEVVPDAAAAAGLRVWDLPPDVAEDDLIFLFENKRKTDGGTVTRVSLNTAKHEAVVFFEDPEAVERVLQKAPIKLRRRIIQVARDTLGTSEEGKLQEEVELEESPLKTVEVTNFRPEISDDALELYLENVRKGGGPLEFFKMDRDKGLVLAEFRDASVAAAFVEREHTLSGCKLVVKWHTPAPPSPEPVAPQSYPDRLLLSGVTEITTMNCLSYFIEAKIGCTPLECIRGKLPGVIMVLFDAEPDIEKLRAVCQSRTLEGAWISVDPIPVSRTVLVRNLNLTTSKDAVELYFEATKRSGGGEIEDVRMLTGENSCLVTFLDPEVAIRVCEKKEHTLDKTSLEVSLYHECLGKSIGNQSEDCQGQGAVYSDRVLLKGVSSKTTEENLNNFLLARIGCPAEEFLCGETPGVILVVFNSEPDFGRLEKVCEKFHLEGVRLLVERVPISCTVQVKNLPATAANSQDALELYFESPRSLGGEVTQVEMTPKKNSCLVTFKDHTVALRVCGKKNHKLDGVSLDVSLYYKCLGQEGGSRLGDFRLPQPLELKQLDKYKVLYLRGASNLCKALEDELKTVWACVRWPKKKTGTTVILDCTLTPEVEGVRQLVSRWADNVQGIFQTYMSELIVLKQIQVDEKLWAQVEEKLPSVQVQSKEAVTLFVEKVDFRLIIAGMQLPVTEIVTQVEKLISGLKEEADRKMREVQESITSLKSFQLLLLRALKFPSKATSKYAGLSVDIQQNAINFKGLPEDVKNATVDMYAAISSASSQTVGEFTREQLALLNSSSMKSQLVEKFRTDKVVGVWEVQGDKVVVCSSKMADAIKVASILKKTLMDAIDPVPENAKSQSVEKSAVPDSFETERSVPTPKPEHQEREPSWTSARRKQIPSQEHSPKHFSPPRQRREQSPPSFKKKYTDLPYGTEEESPAATSEKYTRYQSTPGRNIPPVSLPGGLVIALCKTDITKQKVCAVVNATNEQMSFGGGVSRAIAVAAGASFQKECNDYVQNNGQISVSEVCVTGPGNLPCDMVIHAVGPKWNKAKPELCKKQLHDTYLNILQEASDRDCRQIAVPAISSGIFGMPLDSCVEAYSKALVEFDRKNPRSTLKKVFFVDVKDNILNALERELKSQVASTQSDTYMRDEVAHWTSSTYEYAYDEDE